MEPSESYDVIRYIPAANLPYSQPGSCYTLVHLPEDDPTAGRNTGAHGSGDCKGTDAKKLTVHNIRIANRLIKVILQPKAETLLEVTTVCMYKVQSSNS